VLYYLVDNVVKNLARRKTTLDLLGIKVIIRSGRIILVLMIKSY